MKKKKFTYVCRYYDNDLNVKDVEKKFTSVSGDIDFSKIVAAFKTVPDIKHIIGINLVSVSDNDPELIWVLCESFVSGVKPSWIPAVRYSDGTIDSINGSLRCEEGCPDKYIKPFTECPFEGYKIVKIEDK